MIILIPKQKASLGSIASQRRQQMDMTDGVVQEDLTQNAFSTELLAKSSSRQHSLRPELRSVSMWYHRMKSGLKKQLKTKKISKNGEITMVRNQMMLSSCLQMLRCP